MQANTSCQFSSPTSDKGSTGSSNGSCSSWNQQEPIRQENVLDVLPEPWIESLLPDITPLATNNAPVSTGTVQTNSVQYYTNNGNGVPVDLPSILHLGSPIANDYTATNACAMIEGPINEPNNLPVSHSPIMSGASWNNQQAHNRYASQSTSNTFNGVKKDKRIRTAFTTPQVLELEKEFARTPYLDRSRRLELADELRINERTIKIWFQNRRMKEKKKHEEECSEPLYTIQPVPDSTKNNLKTHERYQSIPNNLFNQGNNVQVSAINMPQTVQQVPPVYENMYQDSGHIYNGHQWQESQQENTNNLQQYSMEYNNQT